MSDMSEMKFKALTLEYRAFRAVALWFDVGTTVAASLAWVALALALLNHGVWGVVLGAMSIVMCLRFQGGLSEKFRIIQACVNDMLSSSGAGSDAVFRHDRGKHNSKFRRFGDSLFFGSSYLIAIVAVILAIFR